MRVVSCFLGYLFGTRVRCGDLTGTWVRVTHGEGYGPSRYVWSPPIGWGVGGGEWVVGGIVVVVAVVPWWVMRWQYLG